MTRCLVTIDTELSAGRQSAGWSATDNFNASITGRTPSGDYGIDWQMDRLDDHGVTGIFFVDVMPALVHGEGLLTDIVAPIVARGHDVQLHVHTEWLAWAATAPVGEARGRNIADFNPHNQRSLLALATGLLERAGADRPIAFRAGNFGANDATLDALSALGLTYDSSFNGTYAGRECLIGLPNTTVHPRRHRDMIEIPVTLFDDRRSNLRPAQICAISCSEMAHLIDHAVTAQHPVVTIVTHSFEMLSRDRRRPNRIAMRRFERMARAIGKLGNGRGGFATLAVPTDAGQAVWRSSPPRTAVRMAEQLAGTWLYDRSLRPQ